MTNFAFIMDLLRITAKSFSQAGFDHTLISRWRSGKRRLMPGRRQVAVVAEMFRDADARRDFPVLEGLLKIWYPAMKCSSESEKQSFLEKFLTEKGQTDPDYVRKREVRLDCLRHHDGNNPAAPRGVEAVRLGLLDYLDLIGNLPEPVRFCFVFTEGLSIYLDDPDFGSLLMEKFIKLFEAGHKMLSIMRSDSAMSDAWYFHKTKLYAHLKGYISTLYYSDYEQQGSEKILGIAGDNFALRAVRQSHWDANDTYISIYHDSKQAAEISERIESYISRAQPLAYYGFFGNPDGWLSNISILKNEPCYLFARLPHFCIAQPEYLAASFGLTEDEMALLRREFHPLTLGPAFFDEDAPIRHIFSESDIEDALLKKRHQSHELSAMLGRKVWMPTRNLAGQLMKIQALLKTHSNYEVCFLNNAQFNELLLQIGVWGHEAAISWIEGYPALSCKNYLIVTSMQSLCFKAWNEIPSEMRSRKAANRKLSQWLKKAKMYGWA